jgi:ABC-2 type transport system permease protein
MNARRIRAVARKEVIQILRDSLSLMVVLLMPLMQMALLGYGVNLDIKHVPICVFDREGSQQSEALLKAFQSSQYFSIVEMERDYAGVKRAVDAGRCRMAIVVPPDFSQDLASENAASVQAILDATDDNTANIALGYAQAVVGAYSGSVQLERTQNMGQPPPVVPAIAQYRVWFNEDLVSRNFIIPGVVALVMALVGAQLTSLTISREWERGTMEVLVSTPVTRMELMAGKILPYFVIGLFDAALCLVIGVYWFEAPFRGAVSTLFLTTSLFLVVVLGLGYFISASIKSQIGASQIALIVTLLPTTLLSGFAFPIEQMPPAIQAITYLVPARYYFVILKSIFLKGSGLGDLLTPIAFLAVYAVLMGWLASRAFRKTLR